MDVLQVPSAMLLCEHAELIKSALNILEHYNHPGATVAEVGAHHRSCRPYPTFDWLIGSGHVVRSAD